LLELLLLLLDMLLLLLLLMLQRRHSLEMLGWALLLHGPCRLRVHWYGLLRLDLGEES